MEIKSIRKEVKPPIEKVVLTLDIEDAKNLYADIEGTCSLNMFWPDILKRVYFLLKKEIGDE